MRCADLDTTWAEIRTWLDQRNILVLPALETVGPLVRLDADPVHVRPGRRDERIPGPPLGQSSSVDRLKAVINHFNVQAVYIQQHGVAPAEAISIRIVAAGVVHELQLFSSSYADSLDHLIAAETGIGRTLETGSGRR
jgi:hypothetical protein